MLRSTFLKLLLGAIVAATTTSGADAAPKKIKVLIIDGINNHNWKDTSPLLKSDLEKSGMFTADISTTPERNAPKDAWKKWNPDFSKYDVVVSNYNGPAWPAHVRKAFEKFITNGGGLVNVHAANNAHGGWKEFEKMTGLLWRGSNHGWRVVLDKKKKLVKMPKGEGKGAGHGPQHPYEMLVTDKSHPITKGMPIRWQHVKDELYHGQRGPAEKMNVLAVAFSAKDKRGTGYYEPMVWWIPYGKGKCVTTVLGHVSRGDSKNMLAMRCIGFKTVFLRACEWAASGKVTTDLPKNFPTADKTSVASN